MRSPALRTNRFEIPDWLGSSNACVAVPSAKPNVFFLSLSEVFTTITTSSRPVSGIHGPGRRSGILVHRIRPCRTNILSGTSHFWRDMLIIVCEMPKIRILYCVPSRSRQVAMCRSSNRWTEKFYLPVPLSQIFFDLEIFLIWKFGTQTRQIFTLTKTKVSPQTGRQKTKKYFHNFQNFLFDFFYKWKLKYLRVIFIRRFICTKSEMKSDICSLMCFHGKIKTEWTDVTF